MFWSKQHIVLIEGSGNPWIGRSCLLDGIDSNGQLGGMDVSCGSHIK